MPTLTITANAAGVVTSIRGVTTAIERAEASTRRLAAISSTIEGHFRAAASAVSEADRRSQSLLRTTLQIARASRSASGFSFSGGAGGSRGGAEFARARQEAERTARAAQTVERAYRGAAVAVVALSRSSRGSSGGGIVPRGGGVGPFVGGGSGGGGASGILDVKGTSRILETASKAGGRSFLSTLKTGFAAAGGVATSLATGFISALSSVGSALTSVLSSAISGAFRVAQAGITAVVGAALVAGGLSVREAVASQPINRGFNSITQSQGLGAGSDVLGRLRTASQGTISDRGLQLGANNALFLGAAETTDQLELLITAGRRLGEVMGRTATEGLNDLAIGIGRQSRLILDNLGLIVQVESANEAYAASLGKTSEELTDNERKIAFQTAAFDAINEKLRQLGAEQDTAAKALSRLGASFANFGAQLAGPLLEPIQQVANRWARFLGEELTPESLRGALQGLASAASSAGGSILDTVLGVGEFRQSLSGLSADLLQAITNPSGPAFEILAVRFGAFVDVAAQNMDAFFDTLPGRAGIAFLEIGDAISRALLQGVGRAIDGIADILPGSKLRESLGLDSLAQDALAAYADEFIKVRDRIIGKGSTQFEIDERFASRDRINSSILGEADARIAGIRSRAQGLDRSRPGFVGPQPAGGAALSAGAGRIINAFTGAIETATPAVRKITEERDKELFSLTETSGSLRDLNSTQRESIRISEREADARRRNAESLEAAGADLLRAREGFGAFETIETQARRLANELRTLPDQVQGIGQEVAFARQDLAATLRESAQAERQARDDLARAIRDSARDFLRGGSIDGQNVASRAAQRRFQRDEQRAQRRAVNAAFQSPGLTSFGGNLGGFGAQGISGGAPAIDPRAIQAVAGLDRLEGGGIVADARAALRAIQEENRTAIAEARQALGETLAAQVELTATQTEKEAEAAALQIRITRAVEQQQAVLRDAIVRIRAEESQISAIEAKLKSLERQVRARA